MRLSAWLGLLALACLCDAARARAHLDDMAKQAHTAVDLTQTTYNQTMAGLPPQQPVVLEFFASWCPHCHYYAPIYEKAAKFFQLTKERGQLDVFVARIDCASWMELCNKFPISAFPALATGFAQDFPLVGNMTTKLTYHRQLKPQDIVAQINKLTGRSLVYEEVKEPPAPPAPVNNTQLRLNLPPTAVWSIQDVEGATRMLWHMIVYNSKFHTGPEKRAALLNMTRWWATGHASAACQEGAQKLVINYNTYWPEGADQPAAALKEHLLCGGQPWVETPDSWVTCYSSKPGARGFTCGLWLLFHTSAVRLPDADTLRPAQIMVSSLRAFAHHFFQCQVCQEHFVKVMARPEADTLVSKKDAVLWLWQMHNKVNARLENMEATYGHSSNGDTDVPKIQWPAKSLCPECRKEAAAGSSTPALRPPSPPANSTTYVEDETPSETVAWDQDRVYQFMCRTFKDPPAIPSTTLMSYFTGGADSAGLLKLNNGFYSSMMMPSKAIMWPVLCVLLLAGLGVLWLMLTTVLGRSPSSGGGAGRNNGLWRKVKTRISGDLGAAEEIALQSGSHRLLSQHTVSRGLAGPKRSSGGGVSSGASSPGGGRGNPLRHL